MSETLVIGDIHGRPDTLLAVLRDADLIGRDGAWSGGDSTLWLMGDLVDNGPAGVPAIELAMRLQQEAERAGGRVESLLGNHDVLLLAAYRFGETPSTGKGGTFLAEWQNSGGEPRDLDHLTPEHARWLGSRPAMAHAGDTLLVHADAMFYASYGHSTDEVNRSLSSLLRGDDADRWNHLLARFGEHHAFLDEACGPANATAFLQRFGGTRIVHGHSPICSITGGPAEGVRNPMIYGERRCIDVDGGMYLGGPGFVYRLPDG